MAIALMKRSAGQKLPRPFRRADNLQEAAELLASAISWATHPRYLPSKRREAHEAEIAATAEFDWSKVNTDDPVFATDDAESFAFREP